MSGPILSTQEVIDGVNAAVASWLEGYMKPGELAQICNDLRSRVVGGDPIHRMEGESK